jgi:hypothetical protein
MIHNKEATKHTCRYSSCFAPSEAAYALSASFYDTGKKMLFKENICHFDLS